MFLHHSFQSLGQTRTKGRRDKGQAFFFVFSSVGTGAGNHSVILVSELPEPEPGVPIPFTIDAIHVLCWTLLFIRSQRMISHPVFTIEILSRNSPGHTLGNLTVCVNYSNL